MNKYKLDTSTIKEEINKLIIKTVIAGLPNIKYV
jgi:hypothetical protein